MTITHTHLNNENIHKHGMQVYEGNINYEHTKRQDCCLGGGGGDTQAPVSTNFFCPD